ncbi:hypothetical protein niasHS_002269 [Heterodera schachtii]|uniref:Major facilitator superfamily (MFS) profile domain-containing protein n=1 Tax=Heterodera schachtii TaxID=97005 RepID=A0ABD2KMQ5_HETSC
MAQNEQIAAEEDNHSANANPRKSVTKASEIATVPLLTVADENSSTPKSPIRAQIMAEASAEADFSPNRKSLLVCNRFHEDSCSECCIEENNLLPDNNSEFQSNYSINELPAGYLLKGDLIINQLPTPPDGGFGWVIVAAAFVCNFVVDGVSNSFGSFMSAYQAAFHTTKAATSVIGSLLIGVYLLAGPLSGALLNNFEARKVVIAGTVLSSLAFALSAFSPNIFVHYLLYGFFGGIGFSFIYLPAIVIVSQYFESKRALATGISVAGSGFGTFLIPLILKFFLEAFGWQMALYVTALLTLSCAFCGILFRPLPMPTFDLEKQNKLNEELKQQALIAALQQVESESNVSEEEEEDEEANNGGISPPRRSGATRTSSECTDGQPLLMANGVELGAVGEHAEEANEADSSPITPHNRPPLSPILERVVRRLSKKRGGSQHHNPHHHQQQQQQPGGAEAGAALGRHPTGVSTRTRKPTLASVTSESVWMGSSTQLRQSRLNLCSQLSRVSARSYAQSLSRISQAPPQSIKAGDSVLSIALSGAEPKEFARPLSRNDIFLQGSIRNLKEFENEGSNYHRYRGSQISIPLTVAAQNLSCAMSQVGAGEMAESNSCRFGGSQYSRVTGGAFGVEEDEPGTANDSNWRCVPFPIRHALAQMVDFSLLFEPVMCIICVSNILAMLGFYVPFVFLTDLATSKGISNAEATFLLPFIGIANTLGRVFFGWMADRRWVSALSITNCSLVLCGLLTALCPLLPSFLSLSLYASLFGFIVAAYVCLTSIVLADLLGVERLTNSFGLVVVSRGFASLLGTPIAGIVYDMSDSYGASFIYAGLLIFLSGLVSCIIPMVHRHQRSQLKNEGDYEDKVKRPTTTVEQQPDAQSGKLSVLTERSEENLTEYQRTIQSINQQRALMYELDEYRKRSQRLDEGHEEETEEQQTEGGGEAHCRGAESETHAAQTEANKAEQEDAEEKKKDAEAEKKDAEEEKKDAEKTTEARNMQMRNAEATGNDPQREQQKGEKAEANISLAGAINGGNAIPLQVLN